jgi:hypothetical protein
MEELLQKVRQGDKEALDKMISEITEQFGSEPEESVYRRGYESGVQDVFSVSGKYFIEESEKIQFRNWLVNEFPSEFDKKEYAHLLQAEGN